MTPVATLSVRILENAMNIICDHHLLFIYVLLCPFLYFTGNLPSHSDAIIRLISINPDTMLPVAIPSICGPLSTFSPSLPSRARGNPQLAITGSDGSALLLLYVCLCVTLDPCRRHVPLFRGVCSLPLSGAGRPDISPPLSAAFRGGPRTGVGSIFYRDVAPVGCLGLLHRK